MIKHITFRLKLLLLILFALVPVAHAAASYNTELVTNGGATAGSLSGWDASSGNSFQEGSLGFTSPDGGDVFDFYTGPASPEWITQTIDISNLSTDITAGSISAVLSAYMLKNDIDGSTSIICRMVLEQIDGSNVVVATSQIDNDVLSTKSSGGDWAQKAITINGLNANARSLRIKLYGELIGSKGSAFVEFDGISLKLNKPAAVTTQAVTSIASTTATGNGNITSLGAPNPTAYGICWNTATGPTISNGKVSNGAASATGAFTASMTGLTANTTYYVRAYATNAAGTSYGSEVSFTTKSAQTITFAAPEAQNFGTTPTLAATASSTLAVSFTSSTTGVCTITSGGALSFAAVGTCTINADQAGNAAYTAAPTVTHSFSVAAVAPGAPTIGTATAGDGSASISFTAPASTGGATITGYTVTSSPGGLTGTGTTSPIAVAGLTNGTAYTFTVTATNSAGTGAASAATGSVTPIAPQAITFADPGIQNYGTTPTLAATASSTLAVSFNSSTTGVCTITSGGALSFVSTGTCTISADQAGNVAYTAAPTVTHSFSVAAVAPGAPTIGTATAGDGSASISFTAPASTGGATITGYTVTSSPGGLTGTGTTSPIVVSGLTNGTAYTFTVTATNSAGVSLASSATSNVTPIGSQSITFAALPSVTYGSADVDPGATSSASLVVSYASSVPSVAAIVDGKIHIVGVGTTTITASQVGNASYAAATPVSQNLTVTSAPLTITANNATKALGAADPVFTAKVEGLVNGETETVVKGLVFDRAPGTAAGPYDIVPSGATAANYTITYANGTLTILSGTTGIATHPVTVAPHSTQLAASSSHPFASVASGLGEGKLGTNLSGCTQERCLSLELALPSAASVHVTIFDQLGIPVISWNQAFTATDLARIGANPDGRTSVTLSWNLRASNGAAVGEGVYLWKVEALTVDGQRLETVKKMGVK